MFDKLQFTEFSAEDLLLKPTTNWSLPNASPD